MKRLSVVVLLVVAIAVGWHFAWHKVLSNLEASLTQNLKQADGEYADMHVKTTYKLKPYGYPFKAGFSIEDASISANDDVQGIVKVDFSGENYVYIALADMPKALLQNKIIYRTDTSNFESRIYAKNNDKEASVILKIVRSIGKGEFADKLHYKGNASDIDFYFAEGNTERQRVLTINGLAVESEKTIRDTLLNIKNSFSISGVTFFDKNGENSETLEDMKFSVSLKDFPYIQSLVEAIYDVENGTGTVDLTAVKAGLKESVVSMVEHKSEIRFDEINIVTDKFKGNISGHIFVSDDYKPQGELKITVNNLKEIAQKIVPQFAPLAARAGGGEVNFSIAAKGDTLSFNSFPVLLRLPSLIHLIDSLPDEVERPQFSIQEETVMDDIPVENTPTPVTPTVVEDKV